MNWAPHFCDFLLVWVTGYEMGDEHHNGAVARLDLKEVSIRVLNSRGSGHLRVFRWRFRCVLLSMDRPRDDR